MRCCRHLVQVSYSQASSCWRRFSLEKVVVSVTCVMRGSESHRCLHRSHIGVCVYMCVYRCGGGGLVESRLAEGQDQEGVW